MKPAECLKCVNFPYSDVIINGYIMPSKDIDTEKFKAVMISEAPPANSEDYFYANGDPFYLRTTLQAFNDAEVSVKSLQDILDLGFYLTTAVKCSKTQYGISAATIKNCSFILKEEISLFPNLEIFMLMGDVAIKAFNYITKRESNKNIIPTGSTYKIRKNQFYYQDKRVFPSYLQTGQNYLIEKSKRKMIAEDISQAMKIVQDSKK